MVANRLKDDECKLDYEKISWKIALLEEVKLNEKNEPKKNDIELMHVKFGEWQRNCCINFLIAMDLSKIVIFSSILSMKV
ncbi:hypothetical protein JCGZ_14868 [Jatropha curcas]|uniref:Uncharacterized protein n=1 Tax=Jatropha curcas TaxID=180498 RepID=A0A067KAZ7_JATCU|nr:hypothetical protein JCGZ_14868 [Jatropha curcas]